MSNNDQESNMTVLIQGAVQLGITLSNNQLRYFKQYQDSLIDWNQRLNLTAVREPGQIQRRHFLDSLTCSLVTGDLNRQTLIDVGSGAGFPGIPLKILFPGLRLTLLESVGTKATFLAHIVDELQLEDVQVITARAEEVGQDMAHRQVYDWAVARAVAQLAILIEYLLPLVRLGGYVLAPKGRQAEEELREAALGITILGGGPPQLRPIQIPGQDEPSTLVWIKKLGQTPDKYPRRTGIPAKRPL